MGTARPYTYVAAAEAGTRASTSGSVHAHWSRHFLPGVLSGLNISGSYTRTYASVLRAGVVPHMLGGALSYRYKRFALGVSGKYTDDTPFTTTGRINYRRQRTLYDLNGSVQLTAKTGLFFQVRDLFNGGEYRYELDPSYVRENVTFGTILTFGVKGVF